MFSVIHTYGMNDSEFTIFENVAIFDEDADHSPERLAELVEINNQRVADTGDECPIIIGHTSNDLPEIDQPEIVGYASNFVMGVIGNIRPRAAILATFKILSSCIDRVRKFPRRSVELWDDGVIDPIAIVGASTPRKDLGLLTYTRKKGHGITRYSSNTLSGDDMSENITVDKDELIALIAQVIEQSEVGQYVKQLMEQPKDEPSEGEADASSDDEPKDEPKDDEADKNEASPGGNNTSPPSDDDDDQDKEKNSKDKFARERLAEQYARQLSEKQNEIDDLQHKYTRSQRERELLTLANEYSFAIDEELEYVSGMTTEQFEKHVQLIRKRYRKAPVNMKPINPKPLSDSGATQMFSKDFSEKVVEYATKNKCSFNDALEKVGG